MRSFETLFKIGNGILHRRKSDDYNETCYSLRREDYSATFASLTRYEPSCVTFGFRVTLNDGNWSDGDAISLHVYYLKTGIVLQTALPNELFERLRELVPDEYEYEPIDVVNIRADLFESFNDDPFFFVWHLLKPQNTWRSDMPWWQSTTFSWQSWWYKKQELVPRGEWQDVVIHMPEGPYNWQWRFEDVVWTDRLGRQKVFPKIDMKAKDGEHIPQPGKGENSWDCGHDAIYSNSHPGRSLAIAIRALVGSVLYRRGSETHYAGDGKYAPKGATA